ncbi:hypothetical protein H311_03022 [Anncaliia algerae PRA109]|nr:hypothetical protein H311_03022 [Anncaliia algerae PRA109]
MHCRNIKYIKRVFAKVLKNKKAEAILPTICSQVAAGSPIWTDEHKSYAFLVKNGFLHQSVCHKYDLLSKENGVHTEFVESFHIY